MACESHGPVVGQFGQVCEDCIFLGQGLLDFSELTQSAQAGVPVPLPKLTHYLVARLVALRPENQDNAPSHRLIGVPGAPVVYGPVP